MDRSELRNCPCLGWDLGGSELTWPSWSWLGGSLPVVRKELVAWGYWKDIWAILT